MRVCILGDGTVARIHRAALGRVPNCSVTELWSPASPRSAHSAVEDSDAVIVASPTPFHEEQAQLAMAAGKPTLVELPHSCLGTAAAHTSRYLPAHRRLRPYLREVRQIVFVRHIPQRGRSWTDDAFRHHAAHALDVFLDWFGDIEPLSCTPDPGKGPLSGVQLAGRAGQIPFTVSILYEARLAVDNVTIACNGETWNTDGFTYLRGSAGLQVQMEAALSYEQAVFEQDAAFLQGQAVPLSETARLVAVLDAFAAIAR